LIIWDNNNPTPFKDMINQVICGDCLEVMKHIPDKSVDLVLTDPPYGIDYQSARRTEWQRKDKIYGDEEYPRWIFEQNKHKLALFVFCRWDNLYEIPKPKSFIVWDKGIHSMGDLNHEFGRQWEGIAFYPTTEHKFKKRPIDIIRSRKVMPNNLTHPNEKSIGAIIPLIECHKTDLVLDPFLGSGTTAVACKQLGRNFIGIEKEMKYCEIAERRLAQEYLF
jgi:DNA modification methylase